MQKLKSAGLFFAVSVPWLAIANFIEQSMDKRPAAFLSFCLGVGSVLLYSEIRDHFEGEDDSELEDA